MKKLLVADKCKRSMANYNFLDIGGGFGLSVAHLRGIHKMKTVSIENEERHYDGSCLFFNSLVKKHVYKIPFIPIFADAYDITCFGGAFITYAFIRGSVPNLIEHIYKVYYKDVTCKYLTTSEKFNQDVLMEDKITLRDQMSGVISNGGGSFQIYFYSKNKSTKSSSRVNKRRDDENDACIKIRTAFEFYDHFRNLPKKYKSVQRIDNKKGNIELRRSSRNLTNSISTIRKIEKYV